MCLVGMQVDPLLLLALQRRFPSVLALQTALEDLVRQHAHDASLQVGHMGPAPHLL